MLAASNLDFDELSCLLEDLSSHIQALKNGQARSRQEAVTTATKLVHALETPGEWFIRTTWAEPSYLSALRIASDRNLFQHLTAENDSPKTTGQIAQACKIEHELATKILRVLASMGTIRETDTTTYASNAISKAMATKRYKTSLEYMYPFIIEVNGHAPDFFAKRGYSVPTDPFDSIVQYSKNGKGKHAIQLYQEGGYPDGLTSMMEVWHDGRPHWSDESFFPVRERLIEGASSDTGSVFMVDVGGGSGHDLIKFVGRHPANTFSGSLILQDIPEVVNPHGDLPFDIRATCHDFFHPQPIKGARVYFLHSIIHDHPDSRAIVILKQIAAAMRRGYSKLIIWDIVLEEKGVPAAAATLDWEMMTFFASSERTEDQWKYLIEHEDVGLKVTGIWHYSQYDQSIIEAEIV